MSYKPYHDHHAEMRRLRDSCCYPKVLGPMLVTAHTKIMQDRGPQAWCLAPSTIASEASHYSITAQRLRVRVPCPQPRASLQAAGDDIAARIKAAKSYLQLASSAHILIRPTMLYYAYVSLGGAVSRAFFNWTRCSESHGLSISWGKGGNDMAVTIKDGGAFDRLVAALFLLCRYPTPFDKIVTYSEKPTAHMGPGQFLEHFGKQELGHPLSRISITEIRRFNYRQVHDAVRSRHGIHKGESRPQTALLMDCLVLFMASSCARYRPALWESIMSGQVDDSCVLFDQVFERWTNFGFDRLLEVMLRPRDEVVGRWMHGYDNPYRESVLAK